MRSAAKYSPEDSLSTSVYPPAWQYNKVAWTQLDYFKELQLIVILCILPELQGNGCWKETGQSKNNTGEQSEKL